MESREQTETHGEDREEGSPQAQLMNDEPTSNASEEDEGMGTPEEGGADSVADAAGEGG